MRTGLWVFGVISIACVLSSVTCMTNRELFELVKDYAEDIEEYDIDDPAIDDDDDDDAIELPGNADDEVDVEYLLTKLDLVDAMQRLKEGPPKTPDNRLGLWRRSRRRRRRHHWHNPCKCSHDQCSCCLNHTFKIRLFFKKYRFRVNVCVTVAYLPKDYGFSVSITYNGKRLFHHEISLRKPPPLCYGVPGLRHFVRACVEIYKVNFRCKSLCLRVAFIIDIKVKKFRWNLKLGCFRIPIMGGLEGMDAQQPLIENMEMSVENTDTGGTEEVSMSDLPALYRQLQIDMAEMYNEETHWQL